MNQTASVQEVITEKGMREQLKQQLAQHVQEQPESTQSFHRWMKVLEAAGLVLIAAAFIAAMYISINWKNVQQIWIPIAWFLFAASAAPTSILIGIHSLILRASPPIVFPGIGKKLVTGRGALWAGWGYIAGGLALAAFWGFFAYATWTQNWALLTPLIGFLGVAMGVMIVVGMLLTTIQKLTQTR